MLLKIFCFVRLEIVVMVFLQFEPHFPVPDPVAENTLLSGDHIMRVHSL